MLMPDGVLLSTLMHPVAFQTLIARKLILCRQPNKACMRCRFMYDIMHGVDIIVASIQPALDAASPDGTSPRTGVAEHPEQEQLIDVPIRIAVYLTNAGIILPASSK